MPKELFSDLISKSGGKWHYVDDNAEDTLKERIAIKYTVDPETIITYDELMAKGADAGKPGKWNVIVKPGDGDDSANRNDVLGTYLLVHGNG